MDNINEPPFFPEGCEGMPIIDYSQYLHRLVQEISDMKTLIALINCFKDIHQDPSFNRKQRLIAFTAYLVTLTRAQRIQSQKKLV